MKSKDYFTMDVKSTESCLFLTEKAFRESSINARIIAMEKIKDTTRLTIARNCPKVECINLLNALLNQYSLFRITGVFNDFWKDDISGNNYERL